jgi:hypothetical protein
MVSKHIPVKIHLPLVVVFKTKFYDPVACTTLLSKKMCGTEQLYFTTQGLTGLQGTREEKTEKQKDGPTGWRHSTYRRVTSTFELLVVSYPYRPPVGTI